MNTLFLAKLKIGGRSFFGGDKGVQSKVSSQLL